jgi:hypothetical protein
MHKSLTVGYGGFTFDVRGDYVPYRPARMYKTNGDPGEPAEGGYFELEEILLDGEDIGELLNEPALRAIEEKAGEQIEEDLSNRV